MPVKFTFENEDVQVNIPDMNSLNAAVAARFAAREGFALATINLDHLDKLARDGAFRAAYIAQDFVVADGNPIVWLSRLAARPVSLLPGSELVLPLAGWAAKAGVSVALVGATKATLDTAASAMCAQVPGLRIAATIAPPMGFNAHGDVAEAVLAALETSGAGLTLLALGAPKQEMLAARGRNALPHMGFASIGAGLDFLAGSQTRAPHWVRAIAMEWLWRAATNPMRLGPRYARSLISLPGHAFRACRLRNQK